MEAEEIGEAVVVLKPRGIDLRGSDEGESTNGETVWQPREREGKGPAARCDARRGSNSGAQHTDLHGDDMTTPRRKGTMTPDREHMTTSRLDDMRVTEEGAHGSGAG